MASAGLMLLVALVCASCARQPKMIEADKSYDGRTLTLHAGDTLNLALPENRSTGFSWNLKTPPEPQLETVSESVDANTGSPGAAGTRRWQWKATRHGTATIRLEYRRPWEKDNPPGQVFNLTVQVE